jgi:hypothetical protein
VDHRIEDVGEEVGGDAGAVVDDLDKRAVCVFAVGDVDGAALWCVLEGVVDDVGECALEPVGVDCHRRAGGSLDSEFDAALVGCELEAGSRLGDRVCEVGRPQLGSLVDLRPCVVEQAGDETIYLGAFLLRLFEPFARVADPRCDRVEVAAQ